MTEPPRRHFVLQDVNGNTIEYNHDLSIKEQAEIFKKLDEVRGTVLHVYLLQKTYGEIK